MGDNPLVEEAKGRDFSAGTFVVSDLNADWKDLKSGSWASGVLDGAATALDAQSFVEDPLGQLLSMGAGWLMDHIDPLKTWLNHLTGDPEEVEAHAGTWENVAGRMSSTGSQYRSAVSADLGSMSGDAIESYRKWAEFHLASIESAALGGEGIAGALKGASLFVETVHNIVRDLIAQLVGHIVGWLAEEFFSLGTATAWVVDQVVDEVATLSEKGSKWIHELIDSCEKLKAVLAKIEPALKKLKSIFADGEPKPGRHEGTGHARSGGAKEGTTGTTNERRPWRQGRDEEPRHAEGADKPLPNSHDHDKSHWDNAKQEAKNLPHEVVKDGKDDGKAEVLLTGGHANRNQDDEPAETPEPAGAR